MKDENIFENIIYYLKVYLLEETNIIQKQIESLNLKLSNIEYLDDINYLDELNNSIIIINIGDEINTNKVLNLANSSNNTFITISKNPPKSLKHPNIVNITNIKNIDNKLLKIYKDKYKNENLLLNFSDGIYFNLKSNKLLDNESEIHLTQRELDLLKLLVIHCNNVVLHKTIQSKIWHESYDVSESAYKSLLNKLRGKIGKKSIKSISRKGYAINFQ